MFQSLKINEGVIMSKVAELGEYLAIRMANRFSVPGMNWGFDELLKTTKESELQGVDLALLELYTLVLFPPALVYLQSGKTV
jgi:hypothetical protein